MEEKRSNNPRIIKVKDLLCSRIGHYHSKENCKRDTKATHQPQITTTIRPQFIMQMVALIHKRDS